MQDQRYGTFASYSGTKYFQVYNNMGYWLQGTVARNITLIFDKLEDLTYDSDYVSFRIDIVVRDVDNNIVGSSNTYYTYEVWDRGYTVTTNVESRSKYYMEVDITATSKGNLWETKDSRKIPGVFYVCSPRC
ncbi:MAG: hypothetical protein LUF90_00120 [Rikenellaceae bacterium]|nr:hypothetical protein [Rikenellaceae bacterium]